MLSSCRGCGVSVFSFFVWLSTSTPLSFSPSHTTHLARVERVAQHFRHTPAEEQGDQIELSVNGAHFEKGDGARGAGDGGDVDDAPERPDAGRDLDDWRMERKGGGSQGECVCVIHSFFCSLFPNTHSHVVKKGDLTTPSRE